MNWARILAFVTGIVGGFHPVVQGLQWHQIEPSDAMALPVDQGLQSAAIDRELGTGDEVRLIKFPAVFQTSRLIAFDDGLQNGLLKRAWRPSSRA
jgi:hypothetical protein